MGEPDEKLALPARFADLKRALGPQDDDGRARLQHAWNDLLGELQTAVDEIAQAGPDIIPQVEFADLQRLPPETIARVKRRGAVVIRNVVEDAQAAAWKDELAAYVKANPVEGIPEDDKQFFLLYWTRPQVQARAHPNVLDATVWLNNLYHVTPQDPPAPQSHPGPESESEPEAKPVAAAAADALAGVSLSTPLTYADRFRIRHAGVQWDAHPPHIDGGGIERWEEPAFRSVYARILDGAWRAHDPYDLRGRLEAKTSLYGRPNQASVFRTFQGWLALSDTAPTQGTLQVFPDVRLSNAYLILRPFFREKDTPVSPDPLDPANWELDTSTPIFPGIFACADGGFRGPRLTPASHPHLRLGTAMTSVPHVAPGDMVFWHCDVVHAVERVHTGSGDSAVMYIPAVPLTPQNAAYVERQAAAFRTGAVPPDFPTGPGEGAFVGNGREADVVGEAGRRAMGLVY